MTFVILKKANGQGCLCLPRDTWGCLWTFFTVRTRECFQHRNDKIKNTEQPCDKELPSLTGCKHTTEYAQTMSKYLLMNFNKQNLRFLLAVGSYYLHRFEAA